eukprot:11283446-Ditylum_brightwellii.AAC.1
MQEDRKEVELEKDITKDNGKEEEVFQKLIEFCTDILSGQQQRSVNDDKVQTLKENMQIQKQHKRGQIQVREIFPSGIHLSADMTMCKRILRE